MIIKPAPCLCVYTIITAKEVEMASISWVQSCFRSIITGGGGGGRAAFLCSFIVSIFLFCFLLVEKSRSGEL